MLTTMRPGHNSSQNNLFNRRMSSGLLFKKIYKNLAKYHLILIYIRKKIF